MAKAIKTIKNVEPSVEITDTKIEEIKTELPKAEEPVKVEQPAKAVIVEEVSPEEKIINYIKNGHANIVDLSPALRSLYPLPTMAQPALYLLQNESKKIKHLLVGMVNEGKIKLLDDTYLLLGKSYWKDGNIHTQHHTINSIKIQAVK